jgi:hypothetical protein
MYNAYKDFVSLIIKKRRDEMAFQSKGGFQKRNGGAKQPAISVCFSVKQGNGYVKGPSFGLWVNDQGGPAFRGVLKEERLAQVLEFLSNAYDADLPVSLAAFDNKEQGGNGGGGFTGKAPIKNNPFKRQLKQPGEQPKQEENQGEDAPF